MTNTQKWLPPLALAGMIALGGAAARAAEIVTNTLQVSAAGLDLRNADGEAALQHRIQVAARNVCGAQDARTLEESTAAHNCMAEAVRSASTQVPALVAAARNRAEFAAATPPQ